MMPDFLTPMMMTQAIVLGCLFLGLIMQVIHAQAIAKMERSMTQKLDQLLEQQPEYHGPKLEDLIQKDFLKQMDFDPESFTPITDEELEEMQNLQETLSQTKKS